MTGRYQEYPEYRDSGVKWLGGGPISWDVIPLKHLAELNPKKSGIKEKKLSELCSFLPMEKLKLNSLKLDETKNVSDVYDGYTYFENEDLLIAKVTPCFENKNMAIAKELHNGLGFGSSEIYVLRANAKLNNQFLFYRLQEDSFMEIAIAAMSGAGGLKRVPAEIINTYTAAFPCIQEQQKIANFLDHETAKIDTLIAKQEKLIALLKEKRQAVISHAVTRGINPDAPMKNSGVEWLGEVPEHWRVSQLKHHVGTVNGFGFSSKDFKESGVPFIRAGNIKNKSVITPDIFLPEEVVGKYKRVIMDSGELIISMVGSDPKVKKSAVGQVGIVPKMLKGAVPNQNVVILKERKNILKRFLFYVVCGTPYRHHLDVFSHKLANQSIISSSLIINAKFTFPEITEQQEIICFLDKCLLKLDSTIEKSEQSIVLIKERKTALISAAVTGKIDVRNWQHKEAV